MPEQTILPDLPIGISDWSEIRADDLFFVDKTAPLARLVMNQRKIFLSRPRRMGKSSLISMLGDLFAHGVKNFEGTAIYDKWPVKETFPVITLPFNNVTGANADEIVSSFKTLLAKACKHAGFKEVVKTDQELGDYLSYLEDVSQGKRLVFLIDEWDAPLSSNLGNQALCESILAIFKEFYEWLRNLNKVRFILVTGIMRYHSTSLFGGQDIQDISMEPRWASLVGLIHEELVTNYAPYIKVAAARRGCTEAQLIADLKDFYNGFCFDSKAQVKLYCPLAINKFFAPIASDAEDASTSDIPEFES